MKNLQHLIAVIILISIAHGGLAQVSISTDGSSPANPAMLDVKSTDKGLLPPRMTTAQREAIASPSFGLLIYNTDCEDMQYYDGSGWIPVTLEGMLSAPGSIIGNATPCANTTGFSYSVTAIPGATGYTWTVPPDATITNGQGTANIAVTFGFASGAICVAAVNGCYRGGMCCLNVTVLPVLPASVSISANANPACGGTVVVFTAVPVNGGASPQYQWKKNGTNISGATSATYSYIPVNNDVLICNMIPDRSCVTGSPAVSNAVTMMVNPSVPAGITISASANPVCQGTTVVFTSSVTNGGTAPMYMWKLNSNNTGDEGSTFEYIFTAGNDQVSCVLTSNAVCASPNPATSNIITMTVNPNANVNVVINVDPSYECGDDSATFVANVSGNNIPPAYQWKDSGVIVSGATNSNYRTVYSHRVDCDVPTGYTCPQVATGFIQHGLANAIVNPLCYGEPIQLHCNNAVGGCGAVGSSTYHWTNSSGSWQSTLVNPVIYSGEVGYATDIFYLTTEFYPPPNGKWRGWVCVTVFSQPIAPATGIPVTSSTQITWNWGSVPGATGYKWNISDSYASATDMGNITSFTETGLTPGTSYTRYVWAYNPCMNSTSAALVAQALACGNSFTINHTSGVVAPVSKTVSYGTATNIPGEPSKCWITQNLGASQQATAVGDATEASAGWYWQFNRKQGYKHDGSTETPPWTISNINENSDWLSSNDPCNIEFGNAWRIPTYTEWFNVDATGNWTNWNGPWNSVLKLHAAGYLKETGGNLQNRGTEGHYWSNLHSSNSNAQSLLFKSNQSQTDPFNKARGFSVRCCKD